MRRSPFFLCFRATSNALRYLKCMQIAEERASTFVSRTQKTWGILTWRAGKLSRPRSGLYRSRLLHPNTRLKPLAEIYTMHSVLQLSKLNVLSKHFPSFSEISLNFTQICYMILLNVAGVLLNVDKILPEFYPNSPSFARI